MSPSGVKVSPVGIGFFVFIVVVVFYLTFNHFGKNDVSISVQDNHVSMKALLIASIDVAMRGGKMVKEVKESADLGEESKGETKEGVNDPLTMGDKLSHQAMSTSFARGFPNVPLISEENDGKPFAMNLPPLPTTNSEVDKIVGSSDEVVQAEDITIWIDPLDATKEYTEDLLQYVTTMVCIAVKGQPIIGVIHKPFSNETYWAWFDHGTNVKEKKDVGNEGEHRIIVSRSHAGTVKETAQKAFGEDVVVVPAGGAGYKSLALYNGQASVYLHTTLIKKWDICAGNAILNTSGGKMTTLSGSRIDYSRSGDPKNDGGLLAALHNHEQYLQKLGYA
uniref:inositol monophosphatase 3-like n=1 Tax=Styela clava TaxID=7725 RepID=UPI00193A8359|nr:inositol monophosphatase 3-like [Styela clava]